MNLFFYEKTPSVEAEMFMDALRERKHLRSLRPLPTSEQLTTGHSLNTSYGDLLILFVTTDAELQGLLAMHEAFNDFQVVLVLKDHSIPDIITSHILKPRFITFADSDINNLEQVILKIQQHTGENPYSLQG